MIKKIKRRFILLSMLPLLLVMVIIVSMMNIVNYLALVNEADQLLQVIFFTKERNRHHRSHHKRSG